MNSTAYLCAAIKPRPLSHSQINTSALRVPVQKTITSVGVFFYIQGVVFGSWASRIPDLKDHLHLGEGALGTILFLLPMGQLTMMPFSGRIVTRFGSRNVLRVALMGYSFILLLIGQVQFAWQLSLCLYLFGLIGNLCNISVNTQGVNAETIHHKPVFSTFHGLWSLGGFTGALVGWLMIRYQVSPSMHFPFITMFVWVNDYIFQRNLIPRQAVSTVIPKYRFRLPQGQLMLLGLIAFCCMSVEGCMFDWTGVYFRQVVLADERFVSAGYAAFMITMSAGRFMGDRMSVRFGRKRWVMISGVLITIGIGLTVLMPAIVPAVIGCMLTGIGVSSIIPLMYSTAGKDTQIASGIAIASVAGIGYLGFLLGPPIIGYIAEAVGLRYSFALMGVGGITIIWLVRKVRALN
jgi:MFS family permease